MAAGFREGFVAADGLRIRYMDAAEGTAPFICAALAAQAHPRARAADDRKYRVVVFEMPGFSLIDHLSCSWRRSARRSEAELARDGTRGLRVIPRRRSRLLHGADRAGGRIPVCSLMSLT